MSDLEHRDDDVSEALRRLPREKTPPAHVAAALAATLPGRSRSRAVWPSAVAASLVIAAFAAGRVSAPRPAPLAPADGQRFMLLLYGGPAGGGDDRAAEYGRWAVELRRAGHQVSGERLADEAWTAGATVSDPVRLRGYFIIRARDAAEAVDLARRHPHARDGTVIVREINTP
jgi:hypothetical protein